MRTNLTQYGAATTDPAVRVLTPFVATRRSNAEPLPGVITVITWREPAVRLSRNITPAFACGSVFPTLSTRAIISPLPLQSR